jgi:hypothetical protein
MTIDDRFWSSRLEWSVRALAQPKEVQETLFPGFVCVADELALDFEESLQGCDGAQPRLATIVREAVRELDKHLEQMSGPDNSSLWTDEALARSAEWERVRELARVVVGRAGWPTSPPDPNRQLYVGPPAS